jgi:hypothetical protein
MADKNILEQMLGHLVNGEQQKAEELFHEYVVAQSREIYESLIESEIEEEEVDEAAEETDEAVEEDADLDEDQTDEDLEENFEDIAYEGGDEKADAGDDLDAEFGEPDGEMDDAEGQERSEEELFMDLDSIVDELQSKFDELKGMEAGEHGADGDTGEEEMEGFGDPMETELATVREYVEKVSTGHGAEKKGAKEGAMAGTGAHSEAQGGKNTKSTIDNMKNDMGGTTANILSSKEDQVQYAGAGGTIKGSSLSNTKPTDNPNAKGNVNVPGGNAGKTGFKTKQPGHGAEKKGETPGKLAGASTGEVGGQKGEQSTTSLFRGRR